jgi:cyanophycinase
MKKCLITKGPAIIRALFISVILISKATIAQGYICAVGGGGENYNDWSDAPYSWIVEKSDSGKILILSYADATEWIPNYLKFFGAKEASNIKIDSHTLADEQSTYDELITAKAIFLKGGDQYEYIRLWKGTKTEEAIKYVYEHGGVIAGTSAGEAVLGGVDFSAKYGSVYSDEALLNPENVQISLEDNFLNLVSGVLFDSHFVERGRFGRLIAMLYNYKMGNSIDLLGIGVDDRTAFCISPDGVGEVMGTGAVSIYQIDSGTSFQNNNNYYTIDNLKCDQLVSGWKYNLTTKSIVGFSTRARDINTQRDIKYPVTDFQLTGDNNFNTTAQNNLLEYLKEYNSSQIAIVSNYNNSALANQIKTCLDSLSYSNEILFVDSLTLQTIENVPIINNSDCLIFTCDSLKAVSLLNDTTFIVSKSFQRKIENNTPCYFLGLAGKLAGAFYIDGITSDNYAAYRGKLTNNPGLNIFDDLIIQPLIFNNRDYYENRTAALLYGMMRNDTKFGIYLNGSDNIRISKSERTISGNCEIPFIILNSKQTTKVDSSVYRASGSVGPRQVVGMNNLRISLTNDPEKKYNLISGSFENSTDTRKYNSLPLNFKLEQNYPNPFNPETYITYSIEIASNVNLRIYDVLGREIVQLINKYTLPGIYRTLFNAGNLSSGVYFYRLIVNNKSISKKMLLLK